jgi:hypothetical protein
MNPALQSFVTVELPIVIAITLATRTNNGRITDLRNDMDRRFADLTREMNRLFEDIISRLDRIERKLDNHEERIVRLEERTSPIHR